MPAQEARGLNHTYVGTEHILLGILREGDGVAARVLRGLNINLEETRREVLRELNPNSAGTIANEKPATAGSATSADHDTVDPRKGYDVYCREGPEQVVYRNARFKGIKRLFPRASGFLPEFIELELADGQTIYVAVISIVKFTEHTDTGTAEADASF